MKALGSFFLLKSVINRVIIYDMFLIDFEGLNEYAMDIVEMAQAHCELIVISKFFDKLQGEISGSGVKEQLQTLYYLYAFSLMKEHVGDFLSTGILSRSQASVARKQLVVLYAKVRPNAVSLVDAFNHTDHFLSSALGCYDGDVYNRLYKEGLKSQLNDTAVTDGYEEYIQPILKGNLRFSKL
ncbi:hypothetical protein L7F22_062994 [Adiantum nelumboides]|nr:hypothetical protein [Adiantum nelumboides]